MTKFILLFHGGNITKDNKLQSIKDRLAWMEDLKRKNKFIDGSPLHPEGKIITNEPDTILYIHNDASISGYAIVTAKNEEEAIAIARTAPQLRKEYGSAKAEVRILSPLVNQLQT
jgi:hypothetical protein